MKPLFVEQVRHAYTFFSQDKVRSGELSSANTHASARGLAHIGNIIVNQGLDLISAQTCAKMQADPKASLDAAIRGNDSIVKHNP